MPETRTLSDNEIKLRELYKSMESYSKQKEMARVAQVNAGLSVDNLNLLMENTIITIKQLERKGVQHYPDTAESESVGRSAKEIVKPQA